MCEENRTACVIRGRCAACRAKNCIFSGLAPLHVAKFSRWVSEKVHRKFFLLLTSGKMYCGKVGSTIPCAEAVTADVIAVIDTAITEATPAKAFRSRGCPAGRY